MYTNQEIGIATLIAIDNHFFKNRTQDITALCKSLGLNTDLGYYSDLAETIDTVTAINGGYNADMVWNAFDLIRGE